MQWDDIMAYSLASDFKDRFQRYIGKPLLEGVQLRGLSNFRIGGATDYFFEAASVADLRAAIRAARESGLPHYVMGGGFNLLFDDAGFRGLLIKIALRGMELPGAGEGAGIAATVGARADASAEAEAAEGAGAEAEPGKRPEVRAPAGAGEAAGPRLAGVVRIKAAAGEPIGGLVEFAAAQSLEGIEFLAGIPGTVGGAVFGNAGAFGWAIGDFLDEALILGSDGVEFPVGRDFFEFGYRYSKLKVRRDLLLEAVFGLKSGNREAIRTKISEYLALREEKHPPPETAYAGSYFKNPVRPDGTKTAAGYLLEQAGARGMRVGGAVVSACHCNFIVNENNATARDVLALAAELKGRVRAKFGIELEEEVIFVPAAGLC
jgi:UDP-N-acetylmuramate dehydrogenase